MHSSHHPVSVCRHGTLRPEVGRTKPTESESCFFPPGSDLDMTQFDGTGQPACTGWSWVIRVKCLALFLCLMLTKNSTAVRWVFFGGAYGGGLYFVWTPKCYIPKCYIPNFSQTFFPKSEMGGQFVPEHLIPLTHGHHPTCPPHCSSGSPPISLPCQPMLLPPISSRCPPTPLAGSPGRPAPLVNPQPRRASTFQGRLPSLACVWRGQLLLFLVRKKWKASSSPSLWLETSNFPLSLKTASEAPLHPRELPPLLPPGDGGLKTA